MVGWDVRLRRLKGSFFAIEEGWLRHMMAKTKQLCADVIASGGLNVK